MRHIDVSIVVASFNKGRYIEQTIRSVLQQTLDSWELVIVDDCSTDNSFASISCYAKSDTRIRAYRNDRNRGANYCRNFGVAMAGGEFIVFLDSDDLLSPGCLQHRVEYMRKNHHLNAAVFTMGVFTDRIGDSKQKWIPRRRNALKKFMAHDLPWCIMQPIWKASFVRKMGGFDESFCRLQDVEFHTRALLDPDFRFATVAGRSDCYYRIAQERATRNAFDSLSAMIASSILYFRKYHSEGLEAKKTPVAGTIYHVYYSLLYGFRTKRISRAEFLRLEQALFDKEVGGSLSARERVILKAARRYHLRFVRIPGINRLLFKILIA